MYEASAQIKHEIHFLDQIRYPRRKKLSIMLTLYLILLITFVDEHAVFQKIYLVIWQISMNF